MNSDEKHLPETQSSLLKQVLDYEVNPIKLDNGEIFNPLKDATHRWISTQMTPPPFWGLTCEVLYLTHELKWILSVSDACFTQQGIWYSLLGQNSRHINDREAFEYFLDFQLCVPELLASRERELMKQVKEYYSNTLLRTGEVGENRTGKYCRNATEWIVAARESDPIYCQLYEFSS